MFRFMVTPKIDELLKKRGRSLYWLAEVTGAKYNSLWRLKQGNALSISFDLLDRICDALDCEPGDVLHRSQNGHAKKSKKGGSTK